jgi:hypothetical protein
LPCHPWRLFLRKSFRRGTPKLGWVDHVPTYQALIIFRTPKTNGQLFLVCYQTILQKFA